MHDTWERVRAAGLPGSPGPLDALLCIVDGDKLHGLLPNVPHPATKGEDIGGWHKQATAAWAAHLHAHIGGSTPPETVHGYVLRWCKESLALSGFDLAPAVEHLALDASTPELRRHLAQCSPDPTSVAPALFTDSYPKPLKCLDEARRIANHPGTLKNSPEIDDALHALAEKHLPQVCDRVPDVDHLVDLVWAISTATGPTAPAAAHPSPQATHKTPPPPSKRGRKK